MNNDTEKLSKWDTDYCPTCTHDWYYIDEETMECTHCGALQH